jgi:hypothetical protein
MNCIQTELRNSLLVSNRSVKQVDSMHYLGVTVKAGKRFSCSFDSAKMSFYRAFNAIFAKSKAASSELVTVQLFQTMCMPIIMYGLEAVRPSTGVLNMLNNAVDCVIRKVFNVNDSTNVLLIRSMVGLCPVKLRWQLATVKFVAKFMCMRLAFVPVISRLAVSELDGLLREYDVPRYGNVSAQLRLLQRAIASRF